MTDRTPEPALAREALRDARLTILAHYNGEAFVPRTRPSVVRSQVREIDALLGDSSTTFPTHEDNDHA